MRGKNNLVLTNLAQAAAGDGRTSGIFGTYYQHKESENSILVRVVTRASRLLPRHDTFLHYVIPQGRAHFSQRDLSRVQREAHLSPPSFKKRILHYLTKRGRILDKVLQYWFSTADVELMSACLGTITIPLRHKKDLLSNSLLLSLKFLKWDSFIFMFTKRVLQSCK